MTGFENHRPVPLTQPDYAAMSRTSLSAIAWLAAINGVVLYCWLVVNWS